MIQKKYMPLLAGAMLLITSSPAMAGTFVTEICMTLGSTAFPGDVVRTRLGVTDMGMGHFQLNGVGQATFSPAPGQLPITLATTAVTGGAEFRPNGDIIMTGNTTSADPAVPTSSEMTGFNILLPAGGVGSYVSNFSFFDSAAIPPGSPPGTPPGFGGQGSDYGTASIVSCVGFPI